MQWWQILLIVLASIVAGLCLGALSSYVIKRYLGKREPTPPVEEQLKYSAPDLAEEVTNNLKIATQPWTGKLLPFQTQVWNTLQNEFNKLPDDLRNELAQVYIDIRLANNIVRLSIRFDHRSSELDENYVKLCTSIAERLDRMKPLIK